MSTTGTVDGTHAQPGVRCDTCRSRALWTLRTPGLTLAAGRSTLMCGHAKRHSWTDLETAAQDARAYARTGATVTAGNPWHAGRGAPAPGRAPEPDPDLLIS